RMHEQHKSHEWALRLFEIGGDLKAALRNAALGGLEDKFTEIAAKMKPADVAFVLERAQAWERLMTYQVARNDFDAVAKLYERAKQFDQAGLAYERAKKFSLARKAYERAKDLAAVNRVRELEVTSLIERGDRLGAATVLLSTGDKAKTLEVLKPLPAPKAFHFMQKLKLDEEAKVLASEHLQKSIDANDISAKAKWQELLGDLSTAVESWLEAGRKDKASFVLEQLEQFPRAAEFAEAAGHLDRAQKLYRRAGDTANADRVAALPRPEPKAKAAAEGDAAADGAASVEALQTPPSDPVPPPAASA
ncbi:MAG: DEAD/DEAH box helicase, partial [Archangium sp.]|nr:DEAD/DEAH box helicase [Archangium sp.]